MVPIVFALIPTIVGAAMLIGLNDSGNKGALLFGMSDVRLLAIRAQPQPNSDVPHRYLWECAVVGLRLQRQQHQWAHQEGA